MWPGNSHSGINTIILHCIMKPRVIQRNNQVTSCVHLTKVSNAKYMYMCDEKGLVKPERKTGKKLNNRESPVAVL